MSTQTQPIIPVTIPYGNDTRDREHHDSAHRDILTAVNRDTQSVAASVNTQANNEASRQSLAHAEIRQSQNRNSDSLSTQLSSANVSELLAIQNTSTANLLGVQNSSTATQLAVQNTATNISNAIRDSSQQNANFISQLSLQSEKIGSAGVVESKNIQVNQGRDLGALQLQASQNFGTLQLQACENKLCFISEIKNSSKESAESICKVMQKLAECCCENKILHKDTQQMFIANEAAVLRTALAQAQQDALLAKISAK